MFRRLLIFTIAFIATRDVVVSLIITATFVIIVLNLFNDESEYCILPKTYRALDTNNDGKISPEEIENLKKKLASKLGYQLVDHRLELYCKKKKS